MALEFREDKYCEKDGRPPSTREGTEVGMFMYVFAHKLI